MIFVGLDDTDMPDTPGTNKLAMHLAGLLEAEFLTRWIVRHQLLEDPRVPCTNRNGCVSMLLEPRAESVSLPALIDCLRNVVLGWVPLGSDPGLCVTEKVPDELVAWGRSAQRELLTQQAAIDLADQNHVYLEPLGGTGGGVIGALAAVGLLATLNSGRVVYHGRAGREAFEVSGLHEAREIFNRGVDSIVTLDGGKPVRDGIVDLGKRLRPNMRQGQIVLYVAPSSVGSSFQWEAQRVVA